MSKKFVALLLLTALLLVAPVCFAQSDHEKEQVWLPPALPSLQLPTPSLMTTAPSYQSIAHGIQQMLGHFITWKFEYSLICSAGTASCSRNP
jgi:hypothetical protein